MNNLQNLISNYLHNSYVLIKLQRSFHKNFFKNLKFQKSGYYTNCNQERWSSISNKYYADGIELLVTAARPLPPSRGLKKARGEDRDKCFEQMIPDAHETQRLVIKSPTCRNDVARQGLVKSLASHDNPNNMDRTTKHVKNCESDKGTPVLVDKIMADPLIDPLMSINVHDLDSLNLMPNSVFSFDISDFATDIINDQVAEESQDALPVEMFSHRKMDNLSRAQPEISMIHAEITISQVYHENGAMFGSYFLSKVSSLDFPKALSSKNEVLLLCDSINNSKVDSSNLQGTVEKHLPSVSNYFDFKTSFEEHLTIMSHEKQIKECELKLKNTLSVKKKKNSSI